MGNGTNQPIDIISLIESASSKLEELDIDDTYKRTQVGSVDETPFLLDTHINNTTLKTLYLYCAYYISPFTLDYITNKLNGLENLYMEFGRIGIPKRTPIEARCATGILKLASISFTTDHKIYHIDYHPSPHPSPVKI